MQLNKMLAGLAASTLFLYGCGDSTPSNSDVLKALSGKDPLAAATCVSYGDFKRNNGYKQNDSYVIDYTVTVKAEKNAQECTQIITKIAESRPEMALMTLEFMMTNMFEIASLNTNQPKQVNGQIRMIQSEAGWVEQP